MSPKIEIHKVDIVVNRPRLSDYCIGLFELIPTRKGVKKAIQKGQVMLNDRKGSTGDFVNTGDVITLHVQQQITSTQSNLIRLKVHYEDDSLAIVEKPAGIVVSGNQSSTLEKLLPLFLNMSKLDDALHLPQAIHRLDFPTTGLLLVGKTYNSVRILNKMFEDRAIAKTYHAIVIGRIIASGKIDNPVDGRSAVTRFEKLHELESIKYDRLNLIRLSIETGRKHQIRKHMLSLGNPILGDKQYFIEGKISYGNGLYLHASSLRFVHPYTNEEMIIASDLPKKFIRLFPKM